MSTNPPTPNPKLQNNHHIFFTQLHSPSFSHPSPHSNNHNLNNLLNHPHIHSYTNPTTLTTTLIHINPQTQNPTIITTFITPTNINPNTHYYHTISPTHPNIYHPQ